MSETHYNESNLKSAEHLLGYFDQQVLAAYRNEPHKYTIQSDYFQGELQTTSEYYSELENAGRATEVVSIRFGYRTLKDGTLAIVAWLPDLIEKSKAHIQRWAAFHLNDPEWTTDYDERFDKWARRNLEGSWGVKSGPLPSLVQIIKVINGLTNELVAIPLYKHELSMTLGYPAAENTHRYQDAHKELYGYLIDGLDKECISRLASRFGKSIKVSDKNTIQAILKLLPGLETSPSFVPATNLVSEQRRLASHGVRPPATSFPAFSKFTEDLGLCLEGIKEVLTMLESESGVNGEQAYKRNEAKKWLPRITRPAEAHYSIVQASRIKGKTVERVEFGFRQEIEGVHESEALIIYFTDGSIMSIDTGSNAGNLADDESGLRPEDFHVDLNIQWVPELPGASCSEHSA